MNNLLSVNQEYAFHAFIPCHNISDRLSLKVETDHTTNYMRDKHYFTHITDLQIVIRVYLNSTEQVIKTCPPNTLHTENKNSAVSHMK